MSRFADPTASRTVDLGECLCPGAPHQSDIANIRAEVSARDISRLAGAGSLDETGVAEIMAGFIVDWNLLGPNGEPWPPSGESLVALKPPTLSLLVEQIGQVVEESSTVPNSSGARSRGSSRASASRTPNSTPTPTT